MLPHALNDMVLQLFDHASKGSAQLLAGLKDLLQCDFIHIASKKNRSFLPDDPITLNEPFSESLRKINAHSFEEKTTRNHLCFQLSVEESLELILVFNPSSSKPSSCSPKDLKQLSPFIQQAFSISQQISRLSGDQFAIQYVIEHHPLIQSENIVFLDQTHQKQLQNSANQDKHLQLDRAMLESRYGLTPSEVELTKLLFDGSNLELIASQRCVSKETVRKQLQSILKKTACDSQEMLMLVLFDEISTRLFNAQSRKSNLYLGKTGA